MKFFKPEDFIRGENICKSLRDEDFEHLAYVANAKLSREGKVVYGSNCGSWYPTANVISSSTSKALLINIEPIEKCTHPLEKVITGIAGHNPKLILYSCTCGVQLEPLTFGELK